MKLLRRTVSTGTFQDLFEGGKTGEIIQLGTGTHQHSWCVGQGGEICLVNKAEPEGEENSQRMVSLVLICPDQGPEEIGIYRSPRSIKFGHDGGLYYTDNGILYQVDKNMRAPVIAHNFGTNCNWHVDNNGMIFFEQDDYFYVATDTERRVELGIFPNSTSQLGPDGRIYLQRYSHIYAIDPLSEKGVQEEYVGQLLDEDDDWGVAGKDAGDCIIYAFSDSGTRSYIIRPDDVLKHISTLEGVSGFVNTPYGPAYAVENPSAGVGFFDYRLLIVK